MEGWAHQVDAILQRAPARAMPFSELLRSLSAEGFSVAGRESWVLQAVLEAPGSFRVIPDRLGVWIHWPDPDLLGFRSPGLSSAPGNPWIMSCGNPPPMSGPEGRAVGRMQETLQAWGERLDDGSQVAVARWIGATREAEATLRSVTSNQGREP